MAEAGTFHALEVADVEALTAESRRIAFRVPAGLRDAFRFTPGQYLTLRRDVDGEDLRRAYSICSGPEGEAAGTLEVAVKKVPGGRFSGFVHEALAPGQTLDVMPPAGRFHFAPQPEGRRRVLAFAAGSGITPVMAIARALLAREPHSELLLFYGNRTADDAMFLETLEGLKDRHLGRFRLHHVMSREGAAAPLFEGRLDRTRCHALRPLLGDLATVDAAYLCGPGAMLEELSQTLVDFGLPRARVKTERFHNAGQPARSRPEARRPLRSDATEVRLRFRGRQRRFALAPDAASVLDGALEAGIDLPFSCKGGVCSTCRCRVLEGQVEHAVAYALEPEDLARGYALSCQARPTTPTLELDFDAP